MDSDDPARDEAAIAAAERRWDLYGAARLPYRLLLLAKIIDRATTQHVREVADMSLAEWRVLTHLQLLGRSTAADVSDAAYVDRAEVSRAVGMLLKRGLIQREPNPRNRKSHLLSVTEAGAALHASVRGERGRFFEQWMCDVTESERELLQDALRRIMRRVIATESWPMNSE